MANVKCISVIDESSVPALTISNSWDTFKANYSSREFYLLDPGGLDSNGPLDVPTAFANDPLAFGPITVARDLGFQNAASDWFDICGLNTLPPGSYCSVAIDTSGSMVLDTVQASYNLFIQKCTNAGINLVLNTTFSDENWINPHNIDIPPSVTISVNPTSYTLGQPNAQATLSWDVFGDFTSASITGSTPGQNIGNVSGAGSVIVSPSRPTTYTITATGPGGSNSRSVNLNVIVPPPVVSISLNKNFIVNTGDQSAALTWSVSGFYDSFSVTNVSTASPTGTLSVSPQSTTTYTVTAVGFGGTVSSNVTLTVYQPPSINLFLNQNSIITGGTTNLNWEVTGDVTTTFVDQNIGDVPNNGTTQVSPTVSTTYIGTSTYVDPNGNTYSDSDSVRLVVYQRPTLEVVVPGSVEYGEDVFIEYGYEYANVSVVLTPQYRYRNANNDGFINVNGDPINLTPLSSSAEFGQTGARVENQSINFSPIYNNDGPFEIRFNVVATGSGGQETINTPVLVNIDLVPTNIVIPETEALVDEDPVFAPDPDAFPNLILQVGDVDIPVEVKSNKPIQMSLDNGNTWINIREKT